MGIRILGLSGCAKGIGARRAGFIHIILTIPNGVKMNFSVNTTKRIGQVKNRTVPNKV
jgi:hypothetical protein